MAFMACDRSDNADYRYSGYLAALGEVSGQHEFSLAVTLHLFAKRIYLRNKLVAKSFKLRPGVLFSGYAIKLCKA
ncbi:hypothetical protein [Ruminococcus bicirculans (ex Wegman et al. 2014)]|uniref:hypothetical protein n=1 Tax=Ruminococcus bicirculans (ex Wegman et al. 2014) TaxID=1160721 RepID=UPI00370953FC